MQISTPNLWIFPFDVKWWYYITLKQQHPAGKNIKLLCMIVFCAEQNVCGFRCGVCVCVYAGFRLICKMNSIFDLLNLRNLNQIIYTPQHCRPTILLTEIVQITCKTAIHSNMQIMIDLRLYQVKCVARKYFMDTWPWFVACVPCYVLHYCDLWTLLLYIFLSEETWLWWR